MTSLTFTTSFTLFFLLLYFSVHLQAYTPEEIFTISCGTTGKSFDGQRRWTGDEDTKYLTFQDGTVSEMATRQSPSTNEIPYSIARLSRSQFNYSFPVSPGPKFLRLFFYPSDYPSFPRNQASFTVQSNQFTLLNAFNASLHADALATQTIFREYVVNVNDGERLILTFTPSNPNSYAFINGIEVLSMPTDLYYTPQDDTGVKLVEHGTLFNLLTSFALQTEYRIKSGGQEIPPQNDTGLFRDWADEEAFFIKENPKNNDLPADIDGKMNITVNPDYVAPKELFRTARDQGRNGTLNKISNLTWVFPVDCGFTYVLRLHFCELDPQINNIGDRRFFVYIKSQLAEDRADVLKWSQKQKGVAVHRNYAIMILKNGNQKKCNLSLQMHPYNDDTRYSDAFLNGLEIFKISEAGSNNLAGPNPDPVQTPQNNNPDQNGKISSGSETTTIRVLAGAGSGIVLISLIVFLVLFFRLKRTTKPKDYNKSKSSATSKWETQQVSLSNWVRHCDRMGTITEIVEPTLKKKITAECLKKFCEIGMSCLLEDGAKRPSMKDVVGMLEFTLQLQESAEQLAIEKGVEISEYSFNTTDLSVTSTTSSSEDTSYSNDTVLSCTPFSEIMDPKPR
ncbi:hypothetical protein ACSQ67_008409 [Phaseolus vulgaris]